jgi:hypothetical protein
MAKRDLIDDREENIITKLPPENVASHANTCHL